MLSVVSNVLHNQVIGSVLKSVKPASIFTGVMPQAVFDGSPANVKLLNWTISSETFIVFETPVHPEMSVTVTLYAATRGNTRGVALSILSIEPPLHANVQFGLLSVCKSTGA